MSDREYLMPPTTFRCMVFGHAWSATDSYFWCRRCHLVHERPPEWWGV